MAVKVSEGYPTTSFFGGRVKVERVCFTYKAGNLIPEYTGMHYVKTILRKEKRNTGSTRRKNDHDTENNIK
jgi:hypothetical protein